MIFLKKVLAFLKTIIYESRETSGENKIHAEVSELADEQD